MVEYNFILGRPAQTNNTNYSFVLGVPFIRYDYEPAAEEGTLYREHNIITNKLGNEMYMMTTKQDNDMYIQTEVSS